jgi:hypothetical protein
MKKKLTKEQKDRIKMTNLKEYEEGFEDGYRIMARLYVDRIAHIMAKDQPNAECLQEIRSLIEQTRKDLSE